MKSEITSKGEMQKKGTAIQPKDILGSKNFFISYKRDTALDLATHLHKGLHARGVMAFLDVVDIEKGLSRGEWQRQIDKAVQESQVFLLIMTNGASTSKGVIREIKLAKRDKNKTILAFVDESIWEKPGELIIKNGHNEVKIKDFQVERFKAQNPQDLLRAVCNSANVFKKNKKCKRKVAA